MAELKYWLWLTTRKGLGAAGALMVLDHLTTPERAFYGVKEDFEPLNLPPAAKESLLVKSLDVPNRILGDCDRLSMRIMTYQDAGYPQRLREISREKPSALTRRRPSASWACGSPASGAASGRSGSPWSWPPRGRWWCPASRRASTPAPSPGR